MRLHLKRRKTLRNAGMATVLAAAVLLLSGCWANVVDTGNGNRFITVTKDMSAQIIWTCTAKYGSGSDRAFCALEDVGALCFAFPIKGISANDCYRAENGDWEEMEAAIKQVIGPDDCLTFHENPAGDHWESVGGAYEGLKGCK
jgi:hypothetical protein